MCKDADPIYAAKGAAAVKFLNTGQACISPNRMYVHRSALQPFLTELTNRVSRLTVGNGLDEKTGVGPLINNAAVDKVANQVRDAVDHGAELLCGGERSSNAELVNGSFYEPTILANVNPDMLIYTEETFGPGRSCDCLR